MDDIWITRVYFTGSLKDIRDMVSDLMEQYPGDNYEIRTDNDREIWLVNVTKLRKKQERRFKERQQEQILEEKEELKRLQKKYKK